jgi:hypothetical protein
MLCDDPGLRTAILATLLTSMTAAWRFADRRPKPPPRDPDLWCTGWGSPAHRCGSQCQSHHGP